MKNEIDRKDLDLPISSIGFFESGGYVNLIVGTTLGYLVCYHHINYSNGLKYNKVINNNLLEETIVDVIVSDIDGDGFLEIIVIYFNRKLQIFRIKDNKNFDFVLEFELKELLNFPFCGALIMNNKTPVLYLFGTNMYYKYIILINGEKKTSVDEIELSFNELTG